MRPGPIAPGHACCAHTEKQPPLHPRPALAAYGAFVRDDHLVPIQRWRPRPSPSNATIADGTCSPSAAKHRLPVRTHRSPPRQQTAPSTAGRNRCRGRLSPDDRGAAAARAFKVSLHAIRVARALGEVRQFPRHRPFGAPAIGQFQVSSARFFKLCLPLPRSVPPGLGSARDRRAGGATSGVDHCGVDAIDASAAALRIAIHFKQCGLKDHR